MADPRDDVIPEGHLGIDLGGDGESRARGKVGQIRDYRRGAEIHGHAVGLVHGVAGLHADQHVSMEDRGDPEAIGPKSRAERREDSGVVDGCHLAPFGGEGVEDPGEVIALIREAGWVQHEV